VIPLDSPQWRELIDAYGPATHIPDIVRRVVEGSASIMELYDAFALIERGAATDGALAVVPHLWAAAATEDAAHRIDLLTFIGRVAYAADGPFEGGAPIAAAARADLASTPAENVLDLVLAILAIDDCQVMYDTVDALRGGGFEVRCSGDVCGVEIMVHDRAAHVDEDTTAIIPGTLPASGTTDRDAIGDIVRSLVAAGHPEIAADLAVIAGTIVCPTCGETFRVLDELLDPTLF